MSTLAIIPARGGSKGIPRKNLVPVSGRPLVAWTIGQALTARLIDRTLVSTDDEEIAAVARSWGAEAPFLRPSELATDEASTELALFHALDYLEQNEGYTPELVVLLQPTTPIRSTESIDRAITLLRDTHADSLVSVVEIHPFLWQRPSNAKAHYDYLARPRRQDTGDDDRIYEENGSIYVAKTEVMRRTKNRLGGHIVLFPMRSHESLDIDTRDDLLVAEAVLGAVGTSDGN